MDPKLVLVTGMIWLKLKSKSIENNKIHDNLLDEILSMKNDVDLLISKNASLITEVNMLKEALHIAKTQNAKWFTNHKNLNLLLVQKPNGRAGLGFVDSQTKQKEPGTTHQEPVSKLVPRDTSWIMHYKNASMCVCLN